MNEADLFNFAIKHYNNPICKTAEEFSLDYNTTAKIRKIINRHFLGEELNCRLLLNHFMTFYNVFVPSAATIILFLKLPEEHYPIIKTIATFLNYMPQNLKDYGLDVDSVEFDSQLVKFLREI